MQLGHSDGDYSPRLVVSMHAIAICLRMDIWHLNVASIPIALPQRAQHALRKMEAVASDNAAPVVKEVNNGVLDLGPLQVQLMPRRGKCRIRHETGPGLEARTTCASVSVSNMYRSVYSALFPSARAEIRHIMQNVCFPALCYPSSVDARTDCSPGITQRLRLKIRSLYRIHSASIPVGLTCAT
ncbi:hypothetical protein CERSUDRAFT_117105 [Gelatoporia subvermispora B]|uniref:Uncharacterized protein n=1 Tax=Ceriporiopsis subvermispora (strain B) TaxID=914234 RepID=M2R730_CERS8|nr:hypothetical protein CERSUDRAFT_117105 [Gelatoporia subvermispora B]